MSNELINILTDLGPALLLEIGKWGIDKFPETSPIAKAIANTERDFSDIENLPVTLRAWCKSDTFSELLANLKTGNHNLVDDSVIAKFESCTNFYCAKDTRVMISRILSTFFKNLETELYNTSEGLNLFAQRNEVLFEDTRTDIKENSQLIIGMLVDIKKQLPGNLLADDTAKRVAAESTLHATVDAARSLLQEGKAKAGRSLLRTLRQGIGSKPASNQLRFRIETNMGACAIELNDLKAAKEHLRAAYVLEPQNPKAIANAAIAELMDGQALESLTLSEKARTLTARDSHATSIYMQALLHLNRADEIESLLASEPWITEDLQCGLILSKIRCKQQKFAEAQDLARKCIQLDENCADAHLFLAESILSLIQQALQTQRPLKWRVKPDTIALLKDAERALTRAIELLGDHDNTTQITEAFNNRSIARGMLADFNGALNDCEHVLGINENDLVAIENKGLMLLDMGKMSEAIPYLEKGHNGDTGSVEKAIALADAYFCSNLSQRTIDILEPYWSPSSHDRIQIQIADFLLKAYTKLGKLSSVETTSESLRINSPNNSYATSVLAHQKQREGKIPEAIHLLSQALGCPDANQDLIQLELADLHFSEREFSKAAEYYGKIVAPEANNPIVQKYLASLFNAGKLKEALALAMKLRAGGDPLLFISEIEAQIHRYVGAYDESRKLYWQLSIIEPQKTSHRIDVAVLDVLKGTPQDCLAIVNSIRFDEIENDASALTTVAQLRLELGLPDVLPLAYRARRLAFNNPKIHLAYTGMFLRMEKTGDPILEPSQVGIDCSVHLKDETGTKIFTIIDDDLVSIERGEVLPTDVLAKALLGKSKGDKVVLKEGLEDLSYLISDVQSKFVRAFQQTLTEFTTWFPDNKQFYRVRVKDNDFAKLFSMLDGRHEWVSQAMQFYMGKQLTLGAFAEVIGKGLIDVWAGMVGRTDGIIYAATGTTEEMSREASLLSHQDSIAIELTSLLTLKSLNLLGRLPKRFSKIYVSQSVLDDILQATRETKAIQPSMTVWKEDGQYRRSEHDPASLMRELQFLEDILTFVESSTEVVPITSALDMGRDKFEELAKLIGKSSLSSILVAKEQQVLLYSDQLGLRQLADTDWGVEGVWSQSVLVSMGNRSLLTLEQYSEAVKKLALGNYSFLSINAQTLMNILKSSGMVLTREVASLFTQFHGPVCSEDSCLQVLADLTRLIWLEPILDQNRLWILDLALSSLVTGRTGHKVVPRFKAALQERFFLMPQQLDKIIKNIDLWQKS